MARNIRTEHLQIDAQETNGTVECEVSIGGIVIGRYAMHTRYIDNALDTALVAAAKAIETVITPAMLYEGCEKIG